MKVKNVTGSSTVSADPPTPYNSWLSYWEAKANFKISFFKCPACGNYFLRSKFDGCHVQKANSVDWREWYIIPLCDKCNHRTDEFEVGNIALIPASNNL